MDGYDHATYGDRFAPVYDDWYEGITDAAACAELVAELADLGEDAGGGPVLELGVGTGRLAIPIAQQGVEVVGVDSSRAMLDQLLAKAAAVGADVEAMAADMVDPPLGDRGFAVVLIAYNTLFNLTDPDDQRRCLANAARRLVAGGSVVVEAFVPSPTPATDAVGVRTLTADQVVLSVSRTDPQRQEAQGQYIDITAAGIALRPWHIRWATPDQLDALALDAGLVVADRWSDWDRAPFGVDSSTHITRYVRA